MKQNCCQHTKIGSQHYQKPISFNFNALGMWKIIMQHLVIIDEISFEITKLLTFNKVLEKTTLSIFYKLNINDTDKGIKN